MPSASGDTTGGMIRSKAGGPHGVSTISAHALRLVRYCWRLATQPDRVVLDSSRLLVPDICSGQVRRSIYAGLYEGSEVKAVRKFVGEGEVVIDAGASIGYLSLQIARIVGSDNLYAVEANRDLLSHIEANFRENGVPCPHLIHGLVSAPGHTERPFNISREIWSSSVLDRGNTAKVDVVPCVDLDEMLEETGATVLVCDIEGGECELIQQCRFPGLKTIIMELHPDLFTGLDVPGALASLGGRSFGLREIVDGKVYVFTRQDDQERSRSTSSS
ncbi:MAG: FkbM family methyltransferase [Arenicellales bacterium]